MTLYTFNGTTTHIKKMDLCVCVLVYNIVEKQYCTTLKIIMSGSIIMPFHGLLLCTL